VRNRIGRRILSARGTRVVDAVAEPPLSPSELAERITVPVALIHGGRDPYVPVDDAVLLHARLTTAKRLVVLPEFGHAEAAYDEDLVGLLDSLVEVLLAEPVEAPG
jgi:pimeloyl-ACP methyl ester carboxylesterase